ncbi:MAG: NADP-dependent oxidoreductase [Nitrospira sp.]|nr:NADP-dependent oxidoreductase [Nitrospira sp.]
MKAIRLHRNGGPESLICEEAPIPKPNDGQLLIQVHAAAVTPTEFAWYPTFHTSEGNARPFPIILGHEFSGVVAAIGGSNRDARIGDSVYGLNDWFMDGAQAEYCLVAAASVAPKPATVDHTLAAAVPISALTAWQALVERAQLSKGQRILIHGGAGGVGSVAVQLARYKKAHVIATASAANMNFIKGLGADEVIDYRTTPFETVVRDVDVVLDTVGGETRDRSWGVLRKGGQLVTIAADAEGMKEQRVRDAFFIVEPNRMQLIEIGRLIDGGVIRPIVGAVFSMDEVQRAYAEKPTRGKNVLRISEG